MELIAVFRIQCIGFLFSLKPLLGLSASCSSWERQSPSNSAVLSQTHSSNTAGRSQDWGSCPRRAVGSRGSTTLTSSVFPLKSHLARLPSPYFRIVGPASSFLVHTADGSQTHQGWTQGKHTIGSYWLIDWCSSAFPGGSITAALEEKTAVPQMVLVSPPFVLSTSPSLCHQTGLCLHYCCQPNISRLSI